MVHSSITIIADEDIKDDTFELLEILHILSMLIFNGTLNVVCTVLADLNMRDALAYAALAMAMLLFLLMWARTVLIS